MLPFNIASYALLTHIVASICDLDVGEVIYNGGDCHIYKNSIDQCHEVLAREPLPLPKLEMPKIASLSDLEKLSPKDFKLVGYQSHGALRAPMAV